MKHYTVEITNEALADMEQLYNHIAYILQAPENAMDQYNRIADAKPIKRLNEKIKQYKTSGRICSSKKEGILPFLHERGNSYEKILYSRSSNRRTPRQSVRSDCRCNLGCVSEK